MLEYIKPVTKYKFKFRFPRKLKKQWKKEIGDEFYKSIIYDDSDIYLNPFMQVSEFYNDEMRRRKQELLEIKLKRILNKNN